jgi:hypothetical protein
MIGDDRYVILCNAYWPMIAFARAGESSPFLFVKHPTMAASFVEVMSCEVLNPQGLDSRPIPELLTHLSEAERAQVRSCKPSRIGEVLFNSWD